jgi:hypothetical protein
MAQIVLEGTNNRTHYVTCAQILFCEAESKRPLDRLIPRWEYNIKTDFKEIEYEDVNWTQPVNFSP